MIRHLQSTVTQLLSKIFGGKYFINRELLGNGDRLRPSFVPKGLKNIGNTCFMNSILQAMSSCPSFLEHLVDLQSSRNTRKEAFSSILLCSLNELRGRAVSGPHSASVNPVGILKKIRESRTMFEGNDQHDALELFQAILELVEKDRLFVEKKYFKDSLTTLRNGHSRYSALNGAINIKPSARKTPINPYEGLLARHSKCIQCQEVTEHTGWKPVKMEPFTYVALSIPSDLKLQNRSSSLNSSSPTGIPGLYGGGLGIKPINLPMLSKPSTSGVSLLSCVDYFLQSEERTDIPCVSCTIANVAKNCKGDSLTPKAETSSDYQMNMVDSPTTANSAVDLRFVSPNDSFLVDLDDEDVQEKVSDPITFRMLLGPNKLEYLIKQSMIYTTAIARFPPILCFHVGRHLNDAFGNVKKVNTKVNFPIELDMNQYVSKPAGNEGLNHPKAKASIYQNVIERMGSETSSVSSANSDSGSDAGTAGGVVSRLAKYILRAVVVHLGSESSGHYTAYCLLEDTPKRKWAYFSDERVDSVDESKVLACQAYMLFYDRASPSIDPLKYSV